MTVMAGTAGNIDWVYLNLSGGSDVRVGELISAEAGGLPIYRVIALRDGRAWLRDLEDGADRVTPLSAFHWKALPAARA
jgi:hypothetical protein